MKNGKVGDCLKKCEIRFIDKKSGAVFWANSVNDDNSTYRLVPGNMEMPPSKHGFYGKNRIKRANDRISHNIKAHKWGFLPDGSNSWYDVDVVEFSCEPVWYFEIRYVLEKEFGDGAFDPVRKGFKMNPQIHYEPYQLWHNERPYIAELPLEELERYYAWRKEHYRGKWVEC